MGRGGLCPPWIRHWLRMCKKTWHEKNSTIFAKPYVFKHREGLLVNTDKTFCVNNNNNKIMLSMLSVRRVRALGWVTYASLLHAFETRHGLMLMKWLDLWPMNMLQCGVTVLCESCHCTTSRNQNYIVIINSVWSKLTIFIGQLSIKIQSMYNIPSYIS